MAKFTVTVFLFTLAFSVCSTFSVKLEKDITDESLATLSAEPDPDTTIPSLTESGSEPESTSSDEVTVPLNFVNFHPINRHFPRRPLTTAPFNRRPCHHRRHELSGLQIPFENDMIFAGAEEATDTDHRPHDVDVDSDFLTFKMLVTSDQSEEKMKYHEIQGDEDGSREIMVTRVKLIKRKGEDERGYYNGMFSRKIRKFLNHLV